MRDTEYLISIVVPCYNCEKTIKHTVSTLLNQIDEQGNTCANYQIVLVDDGAIDATGTLCDEFAQSDEHVITIHKENGGLVSAWKSGVHGADGRYIAFCDSDDYIDNDFVSRISKIVLEHDPTIIAFGMAIEFSNGDVDYNKILLKEGYYDQAQIDTDIMPRLLSDGSMESELLGSSRCNKVFKKVLLEAIISDVPDDVSYGEDDITCFAAILNATSIYAINNYYPYHYVRDTGSMIGGYDKDAFSKVDEIYNELNRLAHKYAYQYDNQIKQAILSVLHLVIKKEICRNPYGYSDVKRRLTEVCHSKIYSDCYDEDAVNRYDLTSRVFAILIHRNMYFVTYAITRAIDRLRGRSV